MPHPPQTPSGSELRRVRSLIADLDGIVWEADATSMSFTFLSEGVQEILGWTPSEWLADDSFWADHLHPEDREHIVSRFVRAASAGGSFDEEYRIAAKDGGWIWVRDLGHVVKDVEGKPAFIRGLMVEITNRKALEEEALEAEGRFRRVVEHLPAIVYLEAVQRDPQLPGQMLYVSPQVETLLGFTPEEWIGDPVSWARQFHPEDREQIQREYAEVERTGKQFQAEYRMYTRTGGIRWFRDSATLVRDEAGEPMYWQGTMFDITAERASEDRARESEDRYHTLIEQLPAIVYSEDVTGDGLQLVYINSQVEDVLGITPQEWIADPGVWLENMHPDDRDRVAAENVRTEATGEPFLEEYRMVARDGRLIWFRDRSVLVRDEDGEPRYWQGVMMDITPFKAAESQLAEAEDRYRTLIEQIPVVVYIDPVETGSTIYVSPQSEAVFGYTPEEWYTDPDLWSKIVHPDDRALIEAQPHSDAPSASSYRIIAKDGRTVWVHDQSRLLLDDEGTPLYWQGVLVDVTEQRRSEELEHDLERQRLESERLRLEDEMKTTFLHAVSHDLRTPLAAILGLAITLEREDLELSEAETHDMARRIAVNARKLDGMVADFLDLERLSRGMANPQFEAVDVGALVRELVANSELVTDRRLALDVAPVSIKADPAMLERIVENLLGNTVKHTPGDSRIWVRIERADDGVLLIVEDDGPGVPVEDRQRIFEAFRQGAAAASGSGVGLALVARFAELHGGRAWVQDRVGGGASFRVLLAWEPPELPVSLPEAETDQPTANGSSADNHA